MKKILCLLIVLFSATSVQAGQYTDSLTHCFASSTTGKDRTDLARWLFAAMAAHPDMADISTVSPEAREAISKSAGLLITRLMTESCAKETSAAIQSEGEPAVRAAYEFLGRLATQELLANPVVGASFGATEKYVDKAKFKAVLQPN